MKPLAVAVPANVVGPSYAIGNISLDYGSRPTHDIRPLSLDGPTLVFTIYWTELHVGFTGYYDNNLLHYVALDTLLKRLGNYD